MDDIQLHLMKKALALRKVQHADDGCCVFLLYPGNSCFYGYNQDHDHRIVKSIIDRCRGVIAQEYYSILHWGCNITQIGSRRCKLSSLGYVGEVVLCCLWFSMSEAISI